MMEYTYEGTFDFEVLAWELKYKVIEDSFIKGSTTKVTVLTEASKEEIDSVIQSHEPDGLSHQKKLRIEEFQARTHELWQAPFKSPDEGEYFLYDIEKAIYANSLLVLYGTDPDTELPYKSSFLHVSYKTYNLFFVDDVLKYIEAVNARRKYILTGSEDNEDGSWSEVRLIFTAVTCANEEHLNSIVDMRV